MIQTSAIIGKKYLSNNNCVGIWKKKVEIKPNVI